MSRRPHAARPSARLAKTARRWKAAPLLAVVGSLFPLWSGASGQVTPPEMVTPSDLVQRLDSLVPLRDSLGRELAETREAELAAQVVLEREEGERLRPLLDTIRVGPLTVLAFRDQADDVRSLFEEAWASFPNVEASPSLAATIFTFRWRARLEFWIPVEAGARVVHLPGASGMWFSTRESVVARIRDGVAGALLDDLAAGPLTTRWIGPLFRPGRRHPTSEEVLRLLAASPSPLSRGCLAGDATACTGAAGIGFGTPAVSRLLTLEEAQAMVRENVGWGRFQLYGRPGPEIVEAVEDCMAGTRDACDGVLRERVPTRSLVMAQSGAHLFWYAVRAGGEGAWGRALAAAQSEPTEALSRISGLPLEELADRWRADLLAARPDPRAGVGAKGAAVLVWGLIFTGLALRSSRWRFG